MEIIYIIAGILILSLAIVIFIEKPFYILAILVFMMVYIFNIKIPGPLDARGLITIAAFLRIILFDKNNLDILKNNLLKNKFFIFFIFLISFEYLTGNLYSDLSQKILAKNFFLSLITVFLGFIMIYRKEGRNAFIFGFLLAGLISFMDLAIHYYNFGGMVEDLNIIRPLDVLTAKSKQTTDAIILFGVNHNFPGMITGISSLIVFTKIINHSWAKRYSYILFAFFFIGVFLSTSRSTLLGVVVSIFFIFFISNHENLNLRKIFVVSFFFVFLYASFFITYNFTKNTILPKNLLVDAIYYRIYEEPYRIITGQSQKFYQNSTQKRISSFKFRYDKFTHDFDKFTQQNIIPQLFGFGKGGYRFIGKRKFQDDINSSYIIDPHNGYIMILVERGFIGLTLFLIISFGLIIKSIYIFRNYKVEIPIFIFFIMLLVYAIGQNSELTSSISYLLIGGMISNIVFINLEVPT